MEIRRNPNGTIDEVIADDVSVHFEQMDKGAWWLSLRKKSGEEWFVHFTTKNQNRTEITCSVEKQ